MRSNFRIALVKPLSSTQHGQPTQRAASDGLLKVARILWLRGRRRVALDLRICLLICTTVTLFSAHRAQYSQQVYTCSVSFAMPNRIFSALSVRSLCEVVMKLTMRAVLSTITKPRKDKSPEVNISFKAHLTLMPQEVLTSTRTD